MDWKDDLANLLGGIASSAPVQVADAMLNAPLNAVKTVTGAGIGLINEGLGLLPGQPGYEEATSRAFHSRNPLDAPHAVWNQVRSEEPLWFQAPTEMLLDPTVYTGFGLAGKGAKTLRDAEAAATAAGALDRARTLGALAKPYEIAQGINDAPGKILTGGKLPAVLGGRDIPGLQAGITKVTDPLRKEGGLLALSPGAQLRQDMDGVINALNDAKASGIARTPGKPLPLSYTDFWPHPGLTMEQNNLLSTKLEDGKTWGQFLDERAVAAQNDINLLKGSGVDWDPADGKLATWLDAVKGKPNEAENTKIVRAWHKQGRDLLHIHDPEDLAAAMLEEQLRKERGIRASSYSYKGSLLKSMWGENVFLTPSYQAGNIQGNVLMSLVSGNMDWSQVNPKTYIRNFKMYNAGANKLEYDRIYNSLKTAEQARKYGEDTIRQEVMGKGLVLNFADEAYTSATGTIAKNAAQRVGASAERAERIGEIVGKPYHWNANFSLGADLVPRDAIFSDVKQRVLDEGMPLWEQRVRDELGGREFAAFGNPNSSPSLAAGPLQEHLQSLGIAPGKANRLTRDFVELRGRANAAAKREMEQQQFSYLRTNLDEQVGKFVPFHYWYSRALRFWGEAAIRNPYVMTTYMRASQGIEDAQHDPGLSARQKGFIRLMGTPLGYSLLMNPDALFSVIKMYDLGQVEDTAGKTDAAWSDAPEGMTALGGTLTWMKEHHLGMYPWVDGIVNLMGAYGNTFEPDLLPIRQKALVGAAINFARSQTGGDLPGTPYQSAMGQARWTLSSAASQFLPGWIAQPVAPKAGGSTQEANLETIIENIIIEDNPGISGEQLLQIMSDPESPQYSDAYKKAAAAGLVQQLLSFVSPIRFSLRNDARDVRTAQVETIRKHAEKAGVSPFEYQPKIGDLQFAADYQRLTGKQWKPGDYQSTMFEMDLARAPTEEAKRFIYEDAAYKELGTDSERKVWDTFNALKYGTDPRTAGLPPDAADQVARGWVASTGNDAAISRIRDQRTLFAQRHPQYGAFLDWQDKMRQIQGTYGDLSEYRRQASAQNPNAARYFAERLTYLQTTKGITDPVQLALEMDNATVSAAAYQAIIGQSSYRSQPGAIPGAPRFDTALPGMLPAAPPEAPYNPQENWMRQLALYGQNQGAWSPWR